jgi:uncharacterized delta-60 repeat protein
MRRGLLIAVAVVCGLAPVPPALGAPGDLDTAFSFDGLADVDVPETRDILFRSTGEILAVGHVICGPDDHGYEVGAVQLSEDGDLDRSFGTEGEACRRAPPYVEDSVQDALLRQGRLVVAGGRDFDKSGSHARVARLKRDGSFDRSFSGDGVRYLDFGEDNNALSVLRARKGKLLVSVTSRVGNEYQPWLVRLLPNGSLDRRFSRDGKRRLPSFAGELRRLPSGRILVLSNPHYRLKPDLTLDRAYGTDGFAEPIPEGFTGTTQEVSDGRPVFVGAWHYWEGVQLALLRWTRDGSLDPSFGDGGMVVTQLGSVDPESNDLPAADGQGVAADGRGRLVVNASARYFEDPDCPSRYDYRPLILRYEESGDLDSTFGDGGLVHSPNCDGSYGPARATAIQPDGKIVAYFSALIRLVP